MRKIISILLLLVICQFRVGAQSVLTPHLPYINGLMGLDHTGYKLLGNPVNTTGWQLTGSAMVNGSDIVLTNGPSQTGSIFYNFPARLHKCDSFVVEFDFSFTGLSVPPGQGMSFWYMQGGTPVSFVGGNGGVGLPSNPTGMAVILDIFDNDNNANNPLAATRSFNGGVYAEGSAAGLLGTETNYGAMINGNLHRCKIVYDGAASQVTTTITDLTTLITTTVTNAVAYNFPFDQGHFGFSGSTTSNHCTQTITNVTIKAYPLPPEVITPVLCTDKYPLPFVYPQAGDIVWFDQYNYPDDSMHIAPIPETGQIDTFIWYVAQRNPTTDCVGERIPIIVIIRQSPTAEFDYEVELGCGQDTIQFTNNSINAYNYLWDFGDNTQSTQFAPVHLFPSEGTYRVILSAQNEYCNDEDTIFITLNNPFIVNFTLSSDSICQDQSIVIDNTSDARVGNGIAPKWIWDFGRFPNDTSTSRFVTPKLYAEPGEYTIKLWATNFIPCTDSHFVTVKVDPIPELDFSRNDTIICQGESITFEASYTQEGSTGISWSFGDNFPTITNEDSVIRAFELPGVYSIRLNANYRICADTNTVKQITVNAMPRLNLGEDTALCVGGTAFELKDEINATNPLARWKWSTGDTTSSIMVKHHGLHRAEVEIKGCVATDEIMIEKNCYLDVPNSFTPNNDGNNDYFLPRQLLSKGVTSYSMKVFNRWGQEVFATNNINGRGWDGRMSGIDQPVGVYVFQIEVQFENNQSESYTGNVTLLR